MGQVTAVVCQGKIHNVGFFLFLFFSVVRLGEKITCSEEFEGNTLAFGVVEYNYCVLHKVRKVQSYFTTPVIEWCP